MLEEHRKSSAYVSPEALSGIVNASLVVQRAQKHLPRLRTRWKMCDGSLRSRSLIRPCDTQLNFSTTWADRSRADHLTKCASKTPSHALCCGQIVQTRPPRVASAHVLEACMTSRPCKNGIFPKPNRTASRVASSAPLPTARLVCVQWPCNSRSTSPCTARNPRTVCRASSRSLCRRPPFPRHALRARWGRTAQPRQPLWEL